VLGTGAGSRGRKSILFAVFFILSPWYLNLNKLATVYGLDKNFVNEYTTIV